MIRFRCPSCAATMRASETEAGEKRKCPKCDTTFRIPSKSSNPNADPSPTAPAKTSRKPKPAKMKKEEELVPVICGVCSTRIYATLGQVGMSVECPDCYTQNPVKMPDKKQIKSGPDLSEIGEYDLAPAPEIKVFKTLGAEMLEEAEAIVEQEIEESPQLPDMPFVTGVFTYPFRAEVFPVLLGMAMSWTLFMLLLNWAWELEGFAAAIAPFILAGIAFLFSLVIIPSLVTFQHIMENGANGDDETDIRPDGGLFGMFDWAVDVMPLVMAAAISCVPTLGVFHILRYFLGEVISTSLSVELILAFLAYQLFPLVALSILENNSVLGVYSSRVWGSVKSQAGAWIKFWSIATLLCLIFAGVVLWCQKLWEMKLGSNVISGTILAISVLICGLTIYFRVLGRLAFVLTSDNAPGGRGAKRPEAEQPNELEMSASGV